MEGCEEHQLVVANERIDREVALPSTVLHEDWVDPVAQ
jgi:hypothetical protein